MILLVDVGNSCVKWAELNQRKLGPQQRMCYRDDDRDDFFKHWQLLEIPTAIWVANVAGPQWIDRLSRWTIEHWALSPTFVETTEWAGGVKNGYQNPRQLGVDRWLAMIGAYQWQKGWLCVADCGTACTIDVVSNNGTHLGGVIMPGVATMRQALLKDTYALARFESKDWQLSNTHQSSKINFVDNGQWLAYDTHSGIMLGTLYAVAGEIEYVLRKLEREDSPIHLFLTGGHASAVAQFLSRPCACIPDLVLQGLAVLVEGVAL